jgi:hypothetical protein
MRDEHLRAAPESGYVGSIEVDVRTLDELCAVSLQVEGPLFLKIDTQGYEREVLAGASQVLSRVQALQVEMSLTPMYDGAPSMVEMLLLAEQLGFVLFNISPTFKDPRTGQLLQADGFFVRSHCLSVSAEGRS